jgi:NADH:ubiquinone oxidoreductase subunit C
MNITNFFNYRKELMIFNITCNPKSILKGKINNFMLDYINIISSNNKLLVFRLLKQSSFSRFQVLSEMTIIDNLGLKKKCSSRFIIIYILFSYQLNNRVSIEEQILENQNVLSVVDLFKSSNWLEREIFDMYGVYFIEHDNLRRLLTDYGFYGYPLRKDFPEHGFYSVVYSKYLNRLIYISNN